MFLPILLLLFFIVLGAFFNSSETALISSNPTTLEYLESKGSKKAGRVRRILARIDGFLAAILIGNTLVTAAAASLATYIVGELVADERTAVILATVGTTLVLLVFSEINPKIYAAHHPHKVAFLISRPIRGFMILLYPFVKAFTLLSGLLFPGGKGPRGIPAGDDLGRRDPDPPHPGRPGHVGLRPERDHGDPGHRRPAGQGDHDAAARGQGRRDRDVAGAGPRGRPGRGLSRYPVYRGRLDHIEGLIHTKDLIASLIEGKGFDLPALLRKPFFIPESASVEQALLQMQERAVHLAFVVDEFGNMEGIVTLEDILEEIVGEIRDESDGAAETLAVPAGEGVWLVKGAARIKDVNKSLSLDLPESGDYPPWPGSSFPSSAASPAKARAASTAGSSCPWKRWPSATSGSCGSRSGVREPGRARTIAVNKTAFFNYQIVETFEAGIELVGSEVKSIKEGRISLKESFAEIKGNKPSSSTATSAPTSRRTASTTTRSAPSGSSSTAARSSASSVRSRRRD